MNKGKVLLVGIQKSGNTWIRFIIFNYFNILNNGATRTLTFDELEEIHKNRIKNGIDYIYNDGFPNVHHTHNSWDGQGINVKYNGYPEYFKQFKNILYIIRNPFDTCISYWHFMENREGVNYERNLEVFTKWFLPKWIHHVKSTKHHADLVLDYDLLRKYPEAFRLAIELIIDNVDNRILSQAIDMSSFENIREMSIEVGQPYGLGKEAYKGFFCRDGRSGQYKEVMNKELIKYIINECKKGGLENLWK